MTSVDFDPKRSSKNTSPMPPNRRILHPVSSSTYPLIGSNGLCVRSEKWTISLLVSGEYSLLLYNARTTVIYWNTKTSPAVRQSLLFITHDHT